jgi:hypothetical protein
LRLHHATGATRRTGWIAPILPDHSFESPPGKPLVRSAAGDVLGARIAARALLEGTEAAASDRALATLVLSAALLQCASLGDGEARRRDVADYLQGLLDAGIPGPGMMCSPMQFVRYAAAELSALPPHSRCLLISQLLSLVSDGGYFADCGSDDVLRTAQSGL